MFSSIKILHKFLVDQKYRFRKREILVKILQINVKKIYTENIEKKLYVKNIQCIISWWIITNKRQHVLMH